jgi:3-hydroxybutyryl-CoA dehydratase
MECKGGKHMEVKKGVDAIEIGTIETFSKTVSETDVYAFAGITGDFYGVHVDEEFAKKTRFGTRIAHGAMLVGFISTVMGKMGARIPPPGGVSYRYEVKFTAPVKFGDTVTTQLKAVEKIPERREIIFEAECTNQREERVLEGRTIMKAV